MWMPAPCRTTHQALLLRLVLAAAAAVLVMVLKLFWAMSEACFTAFCTESNAVLAADTMFFIMATLASLPAGAFLPMLSTRVPILRWVSWVWASITLPSSAVELAVISYKWRP